MRLPDLMTDPDCRTGVCDDSMSPQTVWQRLRLRQAERRGLRALLDRPDDRLLDDIGLTRADVEAWLG